MECVLLQVRGMNARGSASTWLGIATAAACVAVAASRPAAESEPTTAARRLDAIHHAQVWKATNVASMDLRAGPRGPDAFAPGAMVRCDFVQRPHGSGSTPKFACMAAPNHELKVRYGKTNGEVYAQVAATRLMWALGFWANRMYPVTVRCAGCPADPFKARQAAPASEVTTFAPATIDFKVEGETIETKPEEGWSWHELDEVDEKAGGAPKAQRDALTLLAVLMQHSSNKAINQRIVCIDPPRCAQTVMMIADVGKTFGRANALNKDAVASVNFREWSHEPIWDEASGCTGHLSRSWSGTMRDPNVGEAGRKFLADLLVQLTDKQLRDLFEVARFTERDPSATVDEWVAAFKHKRSEIVDRHCGS